MATTKEMYNYIIVLEQHLNSLDASVPSFCQGKFTPCILFWRRETGYCLL